MLLLQSSQPIRKPLYGQVGCKRVYIKGVSVRFGFDAVRISQIYYKLSKTKQRGRPLRCIIYNSFPATGVLSRSIEVFIYIGVGLSALLVSTIWAMREPLLRGTGNRLAPRFFMCMDHI